MDSRVQRFFENIRGKKIALIGIARTNLPLCELFAKKGAYVTACDRKSREQLGETADFLEQNGVTLKLGEHYMDDIDADIIFRSPGIYYNDAKLTGYRKKGVVVTSEMEVFFRICPCRTYAVTGSDGKTTSTTVIAKLLEHSGKKVFLGGNIGLAILPFIEEMTADDYAVVELSSFQLISMRESPDVAVITNVSPNHLDVHGTMDEYVQSKLNILLHQSAFSRTVLNLDNEITAGMRDLVRGRLCCFSRKQKVDSGAYCDANGDIYRVMDGKTEFVMNRSDIKLPGDHHVENYLDAISAVYDEVSVDDIVQVAKTFGGVEHRTEFVRELHGVKYYNDSIATSPTRVIAGLKAFGTRCIIIAGGYDKHIPMEPLGPFINQYVKTLILTGDTSEKIEAAVKNDPSYNPQNIEIVRADDMAQAVQIAAEKARPGDIVALEPASAGFDRYKDFEERGRHFKTLVESLQ